jgi:hypothetical protein
MAYYNVASVNAAYRNAKLNTLASYSNGSIKYCILYFYVTERGIGYVKCFAQFPL